MADDFLIKCKLNIPPIYRSGWCSYANSGSNSTGHKISANYKGDVWCISDAEEWYKFDQGKTVYGWGKSTRAVNGDYLGMGFYKTIQDALGVRWIWNAGARKWECEWSIKGLGNIELPMIAAGVTLPVNLALFCGNGEDGGSKGKYKWQRT